MYFKCIRHRHIYIIPSFKCILNVQAIDIYILYPHSQSTNTKVKYFFT